MDSADQDERYVIDSFAWIEYFAGSKSGAEAKQLIEAGRSITPTIVIAELAEKYRREKMTFAQDLDFITGKTRIIPLDLTIAEKAGSISPERKRTIKRWGLADSIVLATARQYGVRVLTGDEHFRDLAHDAHMIK
jgi:predicted nucleic acid-binding protein